MNEKELTLKAAKSIAEHGSIPLATLKENIIIKDKLDELLSKEIEFPEVEPYPEMPGYPTEMQITNLPEVQKVEIINLPEDKDDSETNNLLKTLIEEVKKKDEYEYNIKIDPTLKAELKGEKGEDGIDGEDGKDGKDGAKIEGKDIIVKINELPTNEEGLKIDARHIKNLPMPGSTFGVKKLIAGQNITIDSTNPYDPIINANVPSPTTYTEGSVLFAGAGGLPTEDNANFYYDNANDRLGVGINSPTSKLDVKGDANSDGTLTANLADTAAVYTGGFTGSNTDADGIFVPLDASTPPPYNTTVTITGTAGLPIKIQLTIKVVAAFSQTYFRINGLVLNNGMFRATGTTVLEYIFVGQASNIIEFHSQSAGTYFKLNVVQPLDTIKPVISAKNSSGTAKFEVRAPSGTGNSFIGVNSAIYGAFVTNCLSFGDNSLANISSGTGNIGIGPNAGSAMRISDNNMVFGTAIGPVGVTYTNNAPTNNLMVGSKNITQGGNNTTIGATTGDMNVALSQNNFLAGGGNFTSLGIVPANMIVGNVYQIASLGTSDFTLYGAIFNAVGTTFIATSVGAGTGVVYLAGRAGSTTANSTTNNTLINSTLLNSNGSLNNFLTNTTQAGSIFRLLRSTFVNATTIPTRTTRTTTAGGFVTGVEYTIVSMGTTDFTLVGALTPSVGVIFTATGPGTGTGTASPTRSHVVAIGDLALARDTGMASTKANTAYGVQAGYSVVAGNGNVANGYQALGGAGTTSTVTAPNLVAGLTYIITTLGTTNFALYGASASTVGLIFTATGAGLGTGTATLIVEDNVANGERALFACIGRRNVANGYNALADVTRGDSNTADGYNTGRGITTGRANTIIGANVTGLATTLSNNVILADGDGTIELQIDSAGHSTFNGAVRSRTYTVATLPAAAIGVGYRAFVTDALAPVWGMAVVGGGAVPVPVYSTGVSWFVG
jgi:hypothetical protein